MANGLAAQGMPNMGQKMMEQVVMLLQQGITPEELAQQGIPMEVIEAAMQMLRQQAVAPQEGLAARKLM